MEKMAIKQSETSQMATILELCVCVYICMYVCKSVLLYAPVIGKKKTLVSIQPVSRPPPPPKISLYIPYQQGRQHISLKMTKPPQPWLI